MLGAETDRANSEASFARALVQADIIRGRVYFFEPLIHNSYLSKSLLDRFAVCLTVRGMAENPRSIRSNLSTPFNVGLASCFFLAARKQPLYRHMTPKGR